MRTGWGPGRPTIESAYGYDGLGVGTLAYSSMNGLGRSGTGMLELDGKAVATVEMEKTLPIRGGDAQQPDERAGSRRRAQADLRAPQRTG